MPDLLAARVGRAAADFSPTTSSVRTGRWSACVADVRAATPANSGDQRDHVERPPNERSALASARTDGNRAAGSRFIARSTSPSSSRGSAGTSTLGGTTGAVTMACIRS